MPDLTLPNATAGNTIQGADLQASIDRLQDWAESLNAALETEEDVETAQAIGRLQQKLLYDASKLIVQQIDLITGKALITAQQINDATAYANGVITHIAEWKNRIEKIGKVLDFLAVVLTGDGGKIVSAAISLKGDLDAA